MPGKNYHILIGMVKLLYFSITWEGLGTMLNLMCKFSHIFVALKIPASLKLTNNSLLEIPI